MATEGGDEGRITVVPSIDADGTISVRTERGGSDPASPRATCPFHAMMGHRFGLMLGFPGGGSNACGLAFAHAPCRLDLEGRRPDWDGCEVRNPMGDGRALRDVSGFMVHPSDGADPDGTGVPMPEWFERVMGRPWPFRPSR